ncbi:MAG TPA: threonine--tRNA ligase [Ruminococcaceae bacterium]|mgnify:FL=1|jgi:threonyl-tRNA synthetase|nr:threonine--tRNA ligase [Oscillospiraceae bacterium]HBL99276.1 threonine--tRNA ligase [Oscillospiraceae bacterium]
MANVTLKGGVVKEYENGTTAMEIAKSIGMGLYKAVCICKINGEYQDLRTPITGDCELEFLTFEDDEEAKRTFRHTASHILAQAVKRLYPEAKLAIGPSIANGFYYDFDVEKPFLPEDLEKIEAEMKKIVKEKLPLERFEMTPDEAIKYYEDKGEIYKVELVKEHADKGENISFYKQGEFTELCAGPHIPDTGRIKAFKLTSATGAYWRGSEKNKMLQRIYATAFTKQADLDAYLEAIEEAKKRDHRKLGRELGLFALRDEAPGMPFFLPKGMVLRNTLINYWRDVHKKWGYYEISTPQIMRRSLWETSGHWDHYHDDMYTTVIDGEDFAIKPMNCPGSILVYELEPHSYKEMPLRYGELGKVHRNELSGALHGLFRVRCFTQDDAHILLAPEQIRDEVVRIAQLFDEVYTLFGLPYEIELSTMPEDHIGSEEDWEIATKALADAITSVGKTYIINEGDGAFYGPKLDFHIKDSLGRTWQCGTIQLDYQLPGRFNLEYTGSDGEKHTPVMIHRVVFGSIERFIGVITEHFAGAFPIWLAPVQVKLLPIADRHHDYAFEVAKKLEAKGIRCEVDTRSEKTGYKIREAQLQKIPYMLLMGDKDIEGNCVSVRKRGEGDIGAMGVDEFVEMAAKQIESKEIF